MNSLDRLVDRIAKHANISPEKVSELIEEKQLELSGLVSEEGAAYIIAREFGLSLLKERKKELKIKSLVSGLKSVDIIARIVDISEPRNFEKEKNGKVRKGSVVNLLVGDETGVVRLSLWNEEVDLVRKGELKEDDVIKITKGWIKDNNGALELRVGSGKLEKLEETDFPEVEFSGEPKQFTSLPVPRKDISEVKDGEFCEIRACLVQLFRRNPFYEVCPACGKRLSKTDDKWSCSEHGEVEPKHNMVLAGVLDDGSGNIRAVFFREMAERLFGRPTKDLRKLAEKEIDAFAIYDQFENLGRDFLLKGRVKRNMLTENLELVVNDIKDIDVKKECDNLLKNLSS